MTFVAAIMFGITPTGAAEKPANPLAADKPIKVSAAEATGPIFSSPAAVKENGPDGPAKNVLLLRSKDKRVEMGLYEAGPLEEDVSTYPEDEFMYFLAGGVTLTSADGTVLVVKAGEGVAMPRGWKGHWSTKGYKKYYVTYAMH
ncbi:MAG: cupin domain-containing protein [Pseudomonadota bacterium]|nr:cupin domain-containing protein [Pseudomonadota bacterium]